MKTNLKTFPWGQASAIQYIIWRIDFEKELREKLKERNYNLELDPQVKKFIKEVLGE